MSVGHVLVVGGGIGGLAAATALANSGLAVEVVEATAEFREGGVGLGLPANALRALDAIDVLERVLQAGFEFDRLKVYDYDRKLIVDHRFVLGGSGIPAMAALPRADLHRILLDAAQQAGAQIRMGTSVEDLADGDDAVAVTYRGGESRRFDLVVGFDGVRSTTRKLLFGETCRPKYSGYSAWRVIVERPPEVTCMEFYQGIGSKTGVMPLTPETMYLFHVCPEPGNPRQDPARFLHSLRMRLSSYGGLTREVRARLTASSGIVYSPIETLMLTPPWYRGRVVIAGDAAHTVPPHLTQGAGMALEDAVTLAEELKSAQYLEQQLDRFMGRRHARCAYVHRFAYQMLMLEQGIVTPVQLEEARLTKFDGIDGRLTESDRVMDGPVLEGERASVAS